MYDCMNVCMYACMHVFCCRRAYVHVHAHHAYDTCRPGWMEMHACIHVCVCHESRLQGAASVATQNVLIYARPAAMVTNFANL